MRRLNTEATLSRGNDTDLPFVPDKEAQCFAINLNTGGPLSCSPLERGRSLSTSATAPDGDPRSTRCRSGGESNLPGRKLCVYLRNQEERPEPPNAGKRDIYNSLPRVGGVTLQRCTSGSHTANFRHSTLSGSHGGQAEQLRVQIVGAASASLCRPDGGERLQSLSADAYWGAVKAPGDLPQLPNRSAVALFMVRFGVDSSKSRWRGCGTRPRQIPPSSWRWRSPMRARRGVPGPEVEQEHGLIPYSTDTGPHAVYSFRLFRA